MRFHIPRRHRQWLDALERSHSLHDFVQELKKTDGSTEALDVIAVFNTCVDRMKNFRDKVRFRHFIRPFIILHLAYSNCHSLYYYPSTSRCRDRASSNYRGRLPWNGASSRANYSGDQDGTGTS